MVPWRLLLAVQATATDLGSNLNTRNDRCCGSFIRVSRWSRSQLIMMTFCIVDEYGSVIKECFLNDYRVISIWYHTIRFGYQNMINALILLQIASPKRTRGWLTLWKRYLAYGAFHAKRTVPYDRQTQIVIADDVGSTDEWNDIWRADFFNFISCKIFCLVITLQWYKIFYPYT